MTAVTIDLARVRTRFATLELVDDGKKFRHLLEGEPEWFHPPDQQQTSEIIFRVDTETALGAAGSLQHTNLVVMTDRRSSATGAIALVIAPIAREYGLDYFIATVILAGLFQVILGVAILIFIAQLPQLTGVPWLVYPLVAIGIVIMVVMPRFTKVVPAPLVAIILLTAATVVAAINVPAVGDEGALPKSLPALFIPNVPLTWETFSIIAPYALAMALVGLPQSLMTARLVDNITDTHSRKTRVAWGQGAANVLSGFFGGMGGSAMIGQTMINVKSPAPSC